MTLLFEGGAVYGVVALLLGIATAVTVWFKWKFRYWERHGLECIEPEIPFGSIKKLVLGKTTNAELYRDFYSRFKAAGLKHGGIYMLTEPVYFPVDPEIIKGILITDFQNFFDRGAFVDEKGDPLNAHLFNLEGDKWKNLRAQLTPAFTSGKMKMMFHTVLNCTKGLIEILDDSVKSGQALEIKDVISRFTTDVIGSCAFGLDCNSLKDPNSEFRVLGRRMIENSPIERLKDIIRVFLPNASARYIRFKVTKPDVEKFVMDTVKKTLEYREKNNVYRKDFFHLLLQIKNRGEVADDENITNGTGTPGEASLTLEQIAAQVLLFFTAGFETTATTVSFALFELAANPRIQDKVREEILSTLTKHDNKITYEGIKEMAYLDRVIKETVRKYPAAVRLRRKCTKDYQVPGTSVTIKKGIVLQISVTGLQYDPEYYPDPEKFDPERFTEENKQKRPAIAWLPFGEGPRNCIGLRFGTMQSKAAVATIIKNYRVKLNCKTKLPLVMSRSTITLTSQGGIWLDVEKLK